MASKDDELERQIQQTLESDNAILESCRRFLDIISPAVDVICNNVEIRTPDRRMIYRCIIKRAQENFGMIVATAESEYSYMSTMALRPLCEDLIYGSWLRTLPEGDADKLIILSMFDDILKSISAQRRFLPKAYVKFGQLPDGRFPQVRIPGINSTGNLIESLIISLGDNSDEISRLRNKEDLKGLGLRLGWPKGKLPNIYEMAKQAELSEVYDFFYHGSSKAVHANLHNMSRMVWGNTSSKVFTIASRNFGRYYSIFSLSYGIWLTNEIIERIAMIEFPDESRLIDEAAYSAWLALVIVGLARRGKLPPLVTEEELRWPAPER